jgi:ubiquinone/menaquinone biosynthesis C-methylase UbiE
MRNKMAYLGDPHKAKKSWERKNKIVQVKKDLAAGKSLYKNAEDFWNAEYGEDGQGKNFSLSTEASEDLKKFVRWLERQYKGQQVFGPQSYVVDVGCGNGRNLLWMHESFGVGGVGYDISSEGIKSAEKKREEGLTFLVQNINQKIPCVDNKADLVVDAIVSHVLRKEEREKFKQEVLRVLSTGSYYFLKSLLLDEDSHAKKMIREYGEQAGEENSYIHPTMGIFEHVPTEAELVEFYKDDFEIEKIERSHAHQIRGRANKRRYIVLYLRKK